MKTYLSALLLVALTFATGCGGSGRVEPKKVAVTGTVTVDGQPLPDGMVYFKDIAAGISDSAEVKNGEFSGQAEAGKRRVEILAYKTEVTQMGDTKTESKVNTLPAKYNTDSTLSEEVKADGANSYKFDVSSR